MFVAVPNTVEVARSYTVLMRNACMAGEERLSAVSKLSNVLLIYPAAPHSGGTGCLARS